MYQFAQKSVIFLSILLLAVACVPLESTTGSAAGSPASIEMEDKNYLSSIHSAQIYPATGNPAASLEPSVISIRQNIPLVLTFDNLQPDYTQYQARIIHCDWNWDKSRITSLQYLYEFNEFPITEYEFSENTRIPYVHYRFTVPRVKLPGNYVLAVYRNNNPDDVVLTRRFMVYDTQTVIEHAMTLPAGPVARRENQQINFNLQYGSIPNVTDPSSQIKVVIRQNQRWDNAIFGLRPTGIREGLQQLEYQLFDKSNQFKGGNEFRFFDLRMVQARGQNVGSVQRDSTGIHAFLVPNEPRGTKAYSQIKDLNGQYHLTNVEYPEPSVTSEYVYTHFFLETGAPVDAPVYVAGAFTNYQPTEPFLMRYDAEAGGYLVDLTLKQGWYNYLFLLKNEKEEKYKLEGSFSETENLYEIIVYYKPIGELYDVIIGYSEFSSRRF